MVRETAEGIVFALAGEDVGAEGTDPAPFKVLDNGQADCANRFPSLLSSNRKQLAWVSASVHFRVTISLRRQPVNAI